jgi:hypothetical protein
LKASPVPKKLQEPKVLMWRPSADYSISVSTNRPAILSFPCLVTLFLDATIQPAASFVRVLRCSCTFAL